MLMPGYLGKCLSNCCSARTSDCMYKNSPNYSGSTPKCINSRRFVPRPAESLLHWFFFFPFCLMEFCVAVIQLLESLLSFFCYWLCLHFTKCTWAPNICHFLQRELSVPSDSLLPLPFRCPARVCLIRLHMVSWVMPKEMKGDFSQRSL